MIPVFGRIMFHIGVIFMFEFSVIGMQLFDAQSPKNEDNRVASPKSVDSASVTNIMYTKPTITVTIYRLQEISLMMRDDIETNDLKTENSCVFEGTFTGKGALDYMLSSELTGDEQDAVDDLSTFKILEMPFIRVDPDMKDGFANSENSHYIICIFYKCTIITRRTILNIVIGVRHSYGSYQRAIKKYKKGFDPSLMVAKETTIDIEINDQNQDHHLNRNLEVVNKASAVQLHQFLMDGDPSSGASITTILGAFLYGVNGFNFAIGFNGVLAAILFGKIDNTFSEINDNDVIVNFCGNENKINVKILTEYII